jgi:transposase-like protein
MVYKHTESTTSYDIEDLVIARYQGGCFTRGVIRTMEILLEHRYSASWVSRMTDVIYEKVEDFRHRKNRAMVSHSVSGRSGAQDTAGQCYW